MTWPTTLSNNHPIVYLTCCFILWKALLFIVILSSPSPGYDTSTALLDSLDTLNGIDVDQSSPQYSLEGVFKFIRWDAIYFTQIARRGRIFEQEWAFGYGHTTLLSWLTSAFQLSELSNFKQPEALAGITLAFCCHLSSVILLYQLSRKLFSADSISLNRSLSLVVATLHIVNPAGAFLTAPYSEPVFSFLNFGGLYVYFSSQHTSQLPWRRDLKVVLAGALFGLATTIRSNGILSGVFFAYGAIGTGITMVTNGLSRGEVQKLCSLVLGGGLVALGTIVPQFVAYQEYCTHDGVSQMMRTWCHTSLPSIYSWVQSHYWNNGFLRYWTLSNLPLFILASPMLYALLRSSTWAWNEVSTHIMKEMPPDTNSRLNKAILRRLCLSDRQNDRPDASENQLSERPTFNTDAHSFVLCLALMQTALAVVTLTSAHVQIVNRMASGYPLWYWWIGKAISLGCNRKDKSQGRNVCEMGVKMMVLYGLFQSGLFSCFLPPA